MNVLSASSREAPAPKERAKLQVCLAQTCLPRYLQIIKELKAAIVLNHFQKTGFYLMWGSGISDPDPWLTWGLPTQ